MRDSKEISDAINLGYEMLDEGCENSVRVQAIIDALEWQQGATEYTIETIFGD